MKYTNDIIRKLLADRDRIDREISQEIQKERALYKFSWKRFTLIFSLAILPVLAMKANRELFPETSIFSWEYYFKKMDIK